jgi:hypothetical protein
MVGGSPIFAAPNFGASQGLNFGQAVLPVGNEQAIRRQQPASVAANQQPRVARGKIDDPPLPPKRKESKEKKLALITLPPPEEMGIVSAKATKDSFDWSPVQRRFREAGATCIHVDFLPDGGCKVVSLLATENTNRNHRIEAQGLSEEETAQLALAKLKEWQEPSSK